jgi:hypothetical protein
VAIDHWSEPCSYREFKLVSATLCRTSSGASEAALMSRQVNARLVEDLGVVSHNRNKHYFACWWGKPRR